MKQFSRVTPVQVNLHWVVVLLVPAAFVAGNYMSEQLIMLIK